MQFKHSVLISGSFGPHRRANMLGLDTVNKRDWPVGSKLCDNMTLLPNWHAKIHFYFISVPSNDVAWKKSEGKNRYFANQSINIMFGLFYSFGDIFLWHNYYVTFTFNVHFAFLFFIKRRCSIKQLFLMPRSVWALNMSKYCAVIYIDWLIYANRLQERKKIIS